MKRVTKGYKYRIYPTEEQIVQIENTFGCKRFVYNYFLDMKINLYKSEKKSLSYNKCSEILTSLKKEKQWLRNPDKFSLQNSLRDLETAYKNFFTEIKKGNKNQGFPKFKSKRNNYKSYTTNFTNKNIELNQEKNEIKLPKLKWVRCKIHRLFKGKIISATIKKVPSGKYYVSLNVEGEHNTISKNNNSVGIDLGIKDLVIKSNGQVVENKKLTNKYQRILAKLQRQLSKKEKGSKNFRKQKIKVARLHEKIANIRKNHLHEISSQIVKENQFIFSENLNISKMLENKNLSKSIQDSSWYEFTRQLEYKSKWNDKIYHKVEIYYASSQTCNTCNYKNEELKNLSIRKWVCPNCNAEHDRDLNASINILKQGLKELKLEI